MFVDRAMFHSYHTKPYEPFHLLNQPVPMGLDQIYNRSIALTSESHNSTESRVVSLVFANADFLKQLMLQNLVCSFHHAKITNWVVVAMDKSAAELAKKYKITHVHFDKNYWSGIKSGSLRSRTRITKRYKRMIQLRTNFIRTLLHKYEDLDIVTTDGDTTWTTRPWETLPFGRGETNCSIFMGNAGEVGKSDIETKKFSPSCGFIMIHNSVATRRLYDAWLEKEITGGEKEQKSLAKVLNDFRHDVTIQQSKWNRTQPWDQEKLHICVLDRERYPDYKYVFKDHFLKRNRDRKNVVVFHPNTGAKEAKVRHLKEVGIKQWHLRRNGLCKYK